MLFLSLWASSQFLKQIPSVFRCAVKGSRRMGRTCRSAQLFHSSSPSFCVSSSPPIQPLRASTAEFLDMQEGAMIFFRSHTLPPASGRANAAYLLCWTKRAATMFICFTTAYFWSFTTPEFSFGPFLPEHLEERFASLFLYLYNYQCKIYCSVSFLSVCKATEKCNVLNAAFLLTS